MLSAINFLDQLVLKVDHTTFQLLELKAILALYFLFADFEHLCEVTLQHVNAFPFLTDDALEAIF